MHYDYVKININTYKKKPKVSLEIYILIYPYLSLVIRLLYYFVVYYLIINYKFTIDIGIIIERVNMGYEVYTV